MFDDERLPEAKHPPAAPVVPAGSGEAEDAALLRPGQRQAGMGEQLLRGKVARVAAFEDRPGNVRGEVAKPQHAGEVGARHPLALRDIGEIFAAALGQPQNTRESAALTAKFPNHRNREVLTRFREVIQENRDRIASIEEDVPRRLSARTEPSQQATRAPLELGSLQVK